MVVASPKRGLALKSDSVCADLALFSSLRPWFYGWGSAPSSSDYSTCGNQHDSGFIPMVWGRRAVNVDVWPNVAALLGFNEPNHKQQSNLKPAEAARLWPSVMHAAHEAGIVRLGSPAAAPCGGGSRKCIEDVLPWLDEFLETVQTALLTSLRLIAMCVKHRSYVHFLKVCTSAIGFPYGSQNSIVEMGPGMLVPRSTFST